MQPLDYLVLLSFSMYVKLPGTIIQSHDNYSVCKAKIIMWLLCN